MRPGVKKVASALTFLLAVWFFARYLLPLFSPFLIGAALALAAEPMTGFLTKKLRLPRPVSVGIGVSMTFCFLALAVLILCAFLIRQLKSLSGVLPDVEEAVLSGFSLVRSRILTLSSYAPQSIRPLLQENAAALFSDGTALLGRVSGWLLGLAGNLLSHVPDSALRLGTAVISAFLISAKLPRLRRWLLRRIPKERLRTLLDTLRRIRGVCFRWLAAQCRLMGVTFLLLLAGFILLRIPYALGWALAVCLVDAFPVLGTGTVLLPWGLLCFLQQDNARAIGLISLYAAVTLIRSCLEPRLLGRHLGLDPLATLMAMYAGFQLWGIGGMLLAPILTVIALQILPERRTEGGEV
ncbi:MAG: sporulation integral membrane protein YtvI [Oscillospiraceae bacterium]|nr:sporulation integral membrane protein YtvI [Oscillospiraceae bacterium]